MKMCVLTAMILALPFCNREALAFDNEPVKLTSLELLLGKWYEIARFNHRFERGQDNVTAFYSQDAKGNLRVSNMGWKDGKIKSANGFIKLTDTSGLLRVSFFRPFYSDYRILMMAPNNSYMLVGGSSKNYLWILSRTPTLNQANKNAAMREAIRRGYMVSELLWIDQSQNMK